MQSGAAHNFGADADGNTKKASVDRSTDAFFD